MRIILIDDDATGVFLATRLFHREGLADHLTSFLSPLEAVAFLQEQAVADNPPQVVLLDLNMPVLSGWDVLDALKPLENQLLGRCAVYILTSSLAPSDAARAHDYPLVAGLLHKPLNRHEIQTIQGRIA